jgi:phenylacetate-CoA ligase
MINHIFKNLFFKKRLKILDRKKKLYQISRSIDEIHQYQIDHFNKIWHKTINEIPFYQHWKKKYDLPNFIKNLDELKYFPTLEKKHIQENEDLIFLSSKNYTSISTGGSTGKPIRLPVSKIESLNSYANQYLGRSWWGIKPLDKIIFCWGHSHLFGSGIHGKINQYKRLLYDFIINTKRLNAYDMSLGSIDKYCQIIKKSNPVMIIGYTSSIYRIAKYIDENDFSIKNNSDLKAVVVTSETVTNYDINLIEKIFNTPCVIEYGMAETGVIAYSSKENSENMELFWDTFIGVKDDKNVLNITTINERIFPLINYKTDDLIESNDNHSILKIKKILGRKNDFLKIKIKNNIIESHSEFFTHILKSIKNIENFKIIQKKNLDIEIEYVSINNFDVSEIFFNEISKEFNGVDKNTFIFRRVKDIQKTIAGKSKWIEVEK